MVRTASTPTSLLGRDLELSVLSDAIDADRAAVISGEAGIGKTSLVRAAVAASGRVLHEGGGFATLHWLPYLALRQALASGISGDAPGVAAHVERVVGPDILFIDDVQWIDDESRAVLDLVIGRLMVILAIRTGDAGSAAALELGGGHDLVRLELGGLADAAAEQIVRRVRPDLSAGRATSIVASAGGNPLLLEELAVSGEASAVLERALASQLELLGGNARHAVDLLALAEGGLPLERVGGEIDDAIAAGVATLRDGRVQLRHALVADAVRGTITQARAATLHGELASLMDEPIDRASHLAAAGRPADAMATALAALATTTDVRQRATLLSVAADSAPPATAGGLRLEAARALDELSEWASVTRVLAPEPGGGPEELVEREALLIHAAYATGDIDAARRHIAAATAGDIPLDSKAAVRRSIELATFLVNVDGEVAAALAGLEVVRRAVDPTSVEHRDIAVLSTAISLLAVGTGDPAIVAAGLEEAFADGRYRTAADRAKVLQFLLLMGSAIEQALAFQIAQTARFDAAGVGSVALEFQADAVTAAVLAGHLDEAIRLADDLGERPAPARPRHTAGVYHARALAFRGAFDQSARILTALVATASPDFFGRGEALTAQAELAFWSGRPSVAATLATEVLTLRPPVPWADVAARLALAWARHDLGADPSIALPSPLSPSQAGAPDEVEGLSRWYAGDAAGAAAAFDRAAAGWRDAYRPRSLVCAWAAGESMRRAGDGEVAIARLTAVLAEATAIGFEPLAARIRRSLRLAGVRATAARTQVLAAGGLTGRERELVGLVEHGLTNVEIARRLGLGRPTVARILASAMTKLGVSSRAQLAAIAPP